MARTRRNEEIKKDLDKRGTMKYEYMGCYECNGFDWKCENYICFNETYGEKRNER